MGSAAWRWRRGGGGASSASSAARRRPGCAALVARRLARRSLHCLLSGRNSPTPCRAESNCDRLREARRPCLASRRPQPRRRRRCRPRRRPRGRGCGHLQLLTAAASTVCTLRNSVACCTISSASWRRFELGRLKFGPGSFALRPRRQPAPLLQRALARQPRRPLQPPSGRPGGGRYLLSVICYLLSASLVCCGSLPVTLEPAATVA